MQNRKGSVGAQSTRVLDWCAVCPVAYFCIYLAQYYIMRIMKGQWCSPTTRVLVWVVCPFPNISLIEWLLPVYYVNHAVFFVYLSPMIIEYVDMFQQWKNWYFFAFSASFIFFRKFLWIMCPTWTWFWCGPCSDADYALTSPNPSHAIQMTPEQVSIAS